MAHGTGRDRTELGWVGVSLVWSGRVRSGRGRLVEVGRAGLGGGGTSVNIVISPVAFIPGPHVAPAMRESGEWERISSK